MADRDTQRFLVTEEGNYDRIDEWEGEEITKVTTPETMWVAVHGPPRSPTRPSFKVPTESLDEILLQYIEDIDDLLS